MVKEKNTIYRRGTVCVRIISILLALVFAVMSAPGTVFADDENTQEKPLREVHRVGLENSVYCFFVQHNVVLTPEDIMSRTDEELSSYILEQAGLYMKEANCRLESHKAIKAADWPEKNGTLFLSVKDIESIRGAEPEDGSPVKMYMDLMISKDSKKTEKAADSADTGNDEEAGDTENTEDETGEKEEPYSTYKKISPELIFVAVATEADAASGEDICEEEKSDTVTPETTKKKTKKTKIKSTPSSPDTSDEEILPELRTINMTDRSGDPIEETLKDGSPVSLEWIEPKHSGYEGGSSFTDRIPGGLTGLVIITAVAAGAVITAVIAAKKRKEE